ncbi:MAG: CopG family transcriptional regulator [Planctomycetota bacterium]|nr:CopG family transcriptional regulator [Planctomycetota bacterium]
MRESKVTIKIPRPLYRKIQQVVGESGFDSATDFVVYVLRDLMGDSPVGVPDAPEGGSEFSKDELDAIRRKLKNLGYL